LTRAHSRPFTRRDETPATGALKRPQVPGNAEPVVVVPVVRIVPVPVRRTAVVVIVVPTTPAQHTLSDLPTAGKNTPFQKNFFGFAELKKKKKKGKSLKALKGYFKCRETRNPTK
jgi:hypothetical protein